jgi:hypothetical protein
MDYSQGDYENNENEEYEDEESMHGGSERMYQNKHQYDIDKDNDGLAEDIKHERIKPVTDEATILENGGDARKPDNHENRCNIDWDSNTIVLGAKDFNRKID